ncbi:Scr1 family TA system antitoxin-like transcriptional regulator [Streptomyces olivaceus]
MSVESAARISRVWNPALVPLLLRTPAYARAVEDALRTGPSPAMRERRTLQTHPEGAPPHPLTGVPALSLYRVDADLPDHGAQGGARVGRAPARAAARR